MTKGRVRRWGRAGALATRVGIPVLIGVALVWGGAGAVGELGRAWRSVAAADWARLVLAGVSEAASYLALAVMLRRLVGHGRPPYAAAMKVALIACGLGPILPAAPVEGMVLSASELEARGVTRSRTLVALALAQWYFARALFALSAIAALVVATFAALRASPLGQSWPLMITGGAALAVLFVLMGAIVRRVHLLARFLEAARGIPFVARRADRIAHACRELAHEVYGAIGPVTNRLFLLALGLLASVADAACFVFALRAAGVHAALPEVVLAYAIGMLASFVPLLPAGLGVVETAVPAFLGHFGVAVPTALAGVLAYRFLATLMPAFAGAAALGQLRLGRLAARWTRRRPARTDVATTSHPELETERFDAPKPS